MEVDGVGQGDTDFVIINIVVGVAIEIAAGKGRGGGRVIGAVARSARESRGDAATHQAAAGGEGHLQGLSDCWTLRGLKKNKKKAFHSGHTRVCVKKSTNMRGRGVGDWEILTFGYLIIAVRLCVLEAMKHGRGGRSGGGG